MNSNSIGKDLLMARKEKGIKQNFLAEQCGITPTYLSMLEKGKKYPSSGLLRKLCQELGISDLSGTEPTFLPGQLTRAVKRVALLTQHIESYRAERNDNPGLPLEQLSISYIVYRFCELLELDVNELKAYFILHDTADLLGGLSEQTIQYILTDPKFSILDP